jgi:DNA-binding GntR family transcriptional regulator
VSVNNPLTAKAKPIVYQDRWEVVLEGMRQMILDGELAPGSRIRETELAEHFGVSRGPIRESLRVLEGAGLITREPRKSSFVALVRASDVEEVYTLREVVEVLAVRRALELRPESVVRELRVRLDEFEQAILSNAPASRIVEADINFHDVFYAGSAHHRVQSVWRSFNDPLRIMMRLSSMQSDPEWRREKGGHDSIMSTAADGDIEGCIDATRAHLAEAKMRVLEYVEKQSLN